MRINSYSPWVRIIASLYGAVYIVTIGRELLLWTGIVTKPDYSNPSLAESATVTFCAVLFIAGTVYLWFNEKRAGIIYLVWHFLCWVFSLLLWPDAGMVLVLIFPMLPVATLLMLRWEMANNVKFKSIRRRWRYVLRVLFINYAALYTLTIVANLGPMLFDWNLPTRVDELVRWDLVSSLGLTLLFAALMFYTAFLLSWTMELLAGVLLIVWYGTIIYATTSYPDFANSGPWIMFGSVMLVQAVFYCIYHYRQVRKT